MSCYQPDVTKTRSINLCHEYIQILLFYSNSILLFDIMILSSILSFNNLDFIIYFQLFILRVRPKPF